MTYADGRTSSEDAGNASVADVHDVIRSESVSAVASFNVNSAIVIA